MRIIAHLKTLGCCSGGGIGVGLSPADAAVLGSIPGVTLTFLSLSLSLFVLPVQLAKPKHFLLSFFFLFLCLNVSCLFLLSLSLCWNQSSIQRCWLLCFPVKKKHPLLYRPKSAKFSCLGDLNCKAKTWSLLIMWQIHVEAFAKLYC